MPERARQALAGGTGAPVAFAADDVAWLVNLMEQDTVSPLEGGDHEGLARAQRVFIEGATGRGFALRELSAPPASFLDQSGVPAQVLDAVGEHGEAFLQGQPSAVVALGAPQPPERRLVFNFHMDTVGPHLPPRIEDGVLHGRGAVDDKGPGVAALLGAAAAFAEDPSLAEDIEVLVASVPGEEGGAMGVYGTRWLVKAGWVGRLMVFAEPTGARVFDACSAAMTPRVTVRGLDSTDDYPYDGHNATLALSMVACRLAEVLGPMAERLGAKVCLSGLHTGTAHNRVYGSGELRLNIAYYDLAAADELAAAVECVLPQVAAEVARHFGANPVARRLVQDWSQVVHLDWLKRGLPPLDNRDEAMERLMAGAGLPRHDAIGDGSAFTCDAIWAAASGRYVVACGPGRLDLNGAHTAGEHVAMRDLEAYAGRCRDLVWGFGAWARSAGNLPA
ncbi:M20/M25/M40 family metallo-hydrolase [Streptomyces sp. NPDC097595]|uniref:M20/M25/M40 family metallo-hydrolase n=1 Tax=Streptomyces sp. NPDC097595 TaxID=3366090 RepID=UPI0038308302